MLHTNFRGNRSIDSGEDVEGFLPSWSCNQHHVTKFSFLSTQKFTYKSLLKMAQWFLRKASFNFHM